MYIAATRQQIMKYRTSKLKTISQVSKQVTVLDLSRHRLNAKYADQIIKAFKDIPSWVSGLIMSYCKLGAADIELLTSFKYIPQSIISLDLSHNRLGYKTQQEFECVLEFLPSSITSLNLSSNNLHHFDINLASCFAKIKESVTNLNLSYNHLSHISTYKLIHALSAIHKNVNTLDLSFNRLYTFSTKALGQILAAISANINTVDLSGNSLGIDIPTELTQVLPKIPSTVINLNLCKNISFNSKVNELTEIFSAIPTSILTLHLSINLPLTKTQEELEQIFAAIPAEIKNIVVHYDCLNIYNVTLCELIKIPSRATSIDLSNNNLTTITTEELKIFLASPHLNVKSINLSNNCLGSKKIEELSQIFSTIARSVTSINLSDNNLHEIQTNDLQDIIKCMPDTIQDIELGFHMPYDEQSFKDFHFASNSLSLTRLNDNKEISGIKMQKSTELSSSNLNQTNNYILSFLNKSDIYIAHQPDKFQDINDDCIAFVSKYFKQYFDTLQLFDLNKIKQEYLDYIMSDFKDYPRYQHDIPCTEINQFFIECKCKYQRMSEDQLCSYIVNWFATKPSENHLFKFYDKANISEILNNLIEEKKHIQEENDNILQWTTHEQTVDFSSNLDNSSTKRCRHI
jgi:Ran GTPase-activating protein (RanGAP) involved in mRNA processing and transport